MTAETSLLPLGRIVRLQIQRSRLKLGEKPNRVYHPAPILAVDELILTRDGALARLPDGGALVDVHHAAHPETRNSGGANDLSLGFTAHYASMRAAYGPHLVDGCAGENILVAVAEPVPLARLAGGLAIRRAGGALIWLSGARVAAPCVEFSGYASRSADPAAVKDALRFLDAGRRGFYCGYDEAHPVTIALGDEVLAVGERPVPFPAP